MEALRGSMMMMPSTSGLTKFSLAKGVTSHVQLKKGQKLRHGPVLNMDATNLNESWQFGGNSVPMSMPVSVGAANSAVTSSVFVEEAATSSLTSVEEAATSSMTSVQAALSPHTAWMKRAQFKERQRKERIPLHQLRLGGFAEDSPLMYRQIFVIRSYEVGPDKCTSVHEIFSLFQEMALNHVQLLGIAGDGFGATRAMNQLGLIWVVSKMQVDVMRYPAWPEVIEIDSWVASAGKNGMRRDWVMRAFQTGEVLARATSTWCIMHATTRRLAKIPAAVRAEIQPSFMDHRAAFAPEDATSKARIPKLDDHSAAHRTSHLTSSPADLDMNQHVNNLKYINWVLESIPSVHMREHKLASIVLEYRRECHSSDVVESLTGAKNVIGDDDDEDDDAAMKYRCCEYAHLLRMQDAGHQEILRGKTTWRAARDRAAATESS